MLFIAQRTAVVSIKRSLRQRESWMRIRMGAPGFGHLSKTLLVCKFYFTKRGSGARKLVHRRSDGTCGSGGADHFTVDFLQPNASVYHYNYSFIDYR
jgi:hypothetical protein